MDPSRQLCKIQDSFTSKENRKPQIKKYKDEPEVGSPRTRRNKMRTDEIYTIDKPQMVLVKEELADPFARYSSKTFGKKGIVLANVDAVYNFSKQEDGYLKPQVMKEFNYACLDYDPEIIKYMQYRMPLSVGFTPCGKKDESQIDYRLINSACDAKSLVNYVLKIVPNVDLIISTGVKNYKDALVSALKLCKPGGTFVAQIDENTNNLTDHYITSLCFDTFSLFKPLSENLNENHSFLIAENYKGNSLDWIDLLEANEIGIKISESFLKYEQDYYDSLSQLKNNIDDEEYNLYKSLALWNIF